MTKTENNILLFSITLCWSASYVFIKNLPSDFSVYAYLTMTTGIAAFVLTIVFWRQIRKVSRKTLLRSFILSLFLTVNLILEKKGIELIPSSNASFLSALTILIVPLLMLLFRVKPSKNNVLGAGIIIFGLFLTSRFSLQGFLGLGTFYLVMACLFSAFYIIAADFFTKEENPLLLGIMQMVFTALSGFLIWVIEEPNTFFSVSYTNELLSSIFILAFFTKAYAYIILMFAQKYANPMNVTIIASTEPVVTLLLAVTIPVAYSSGEKLSASSFSGAVLITIGAVVAGSNFFKKKKDKGAEKNAN